MIKGVVVLLALGLALTGCEDSGGDGGDEGQAQRLNGPDDYMTVVEQEAAYLEKTFNAEFPYPVFINVQPAVGRGPLGLLFDYNGDLVYGMTIFTGSRFSLLVCEPSPQVIRHELMHCLIGDPLAGHVSHFNGVRVGSHVVGWHDNSQARLGSPTRFAAPIACQLSASSPAASASVDGSSSEGGEVFSTG